MSAYIPRKEIVIRIVLIAVIMFNAFASNAQPVRAKQEVNPTPSSPVNEVGKDSHSIPTFQRPVPRIGEGRSDDFSRSPQANPTTKTNASSPIMFIENMGQFDPKAQFVIKGARANIFLAQDAIWLTIIEKPKKENPREDEFIDHKSQQKIKTVNLKVVFPGSNPNPKIEPFNKLEQKLSYFLGNSSAEQFTNVPVWGGVRYVDLYPGVDLELTTESGELVWLVVIKDSGKLSSRENYISKHGLSLKITGQKNMKISGEKVNIESELGNFILPQMSIEGSINEEVFSKIPKTSGDQLYLISLTCSGK